MAPLGPCLCLCPFRHPPVPTRLSLIPRLRRFGGYHEPHLLGGIEPQLLDISQEAEERPHLLAGHGRGEVGDLDDGRGPQGEAQRDPDPAAVHHGGACPASPRAPGGAGPPTERGARRRPERPRGRALYRRTRLLPEEFSEERAAPAGGASGSPAARRSLPSPGAASPGATSHAARRAAVRRAGPARPGPRPGRGAGREGPPPPPAFARARRPLLARAGAGAALATPSAAPALQGRGPGEQGHFPFNCAFGGQV